MATAVVLAVSMLLVGVARPLALALLASQVAVFGFTAFVSFQWSVWAQLFARFIWPGLGTPRALINARLPRIVQGVGFALTTAAFVLLALDIDGAAYLLVAIVIGVSAVVATFPDLLRS